MKVKSYKYIKPNHEGIIESLDRHDYMTAQYIDMMYEYISKLNLKGRCAFLYAGGVLLTGSEARNALDSGKYREPAKDTGLCIKELAAYSMHKWIGCLNDKASIEYANINGNTCASSMHSLWEAEQLLNNGFDEVIIVAEEKTAYNTLRVFDEMRIELQIGEGLAIVHLGKDGDGIEIDNTKWAYEYNRNPFGTTSVGYEKINSESDMVNPHGTGTDNNESAEQEIVGDRPQLRYKEKIGHTQGVSGLIEVCMVIDDPEACGDILCTSAGLGGFYGSCIVHKP